jgi:hypothetical protein
MTEIEKLIRCLPRGYKLCHDQVGTWSIVGPAGEWPVLAATLEDALREMVKELDIDVDNTAETQPSEDARIFNEWTSKLSGMTQ